MMFLLLLLRYEQIKKKKKKLKLNNFQVKFELIRVLNMNRQGITLCVKINVKKKKM